MVTRCCDALYVVWSEGIAHLLCPPAAICINRQSIELMQAQAENEAYLQQIEAEGRTESVYGPGVQLVVPQPAFVIKTKDAVERKRVYINICTSDKVCFTIMAATAEYLAKD